MYHVAFHHLMLTYLILFVNLPENEFAFHLTGGREKAIWVYQFGFEYSCVGIQELILEFILGFNK